MPATRAQYEQLLNSSPTLRRFLNLIGWAEGADYNVGYARRQINSFNWHPYNQCAFNRNGTINYGACSNSTTSAAGKYQFQRNTWDIVARQLGLTDFSPRSQDIAAIALIDGRGALGDVINGNITRAIQTLQPEWESFVSRPLNDLIRKFGGSNDTQQQAPSVADRFLNPNRAQKNQQDFIDNYLGVEVIGNKNRYLIAFAILVIIFIFAFN